eukprot:TRINITY_DN10775_c0_g2_i9.p1 TRINITY_DN10775_c0_g2~~TRINITY_DN10775_c0_g2_i9.p1  ORF type:complete len:227 (-),score=46.94 TRINITY_DN10775_c0_g2_i9:56-736(-)
MIEQAAYMNHHHSRARVMTVAHSEEPLTQAQQVAADATWMGEWVQSMKKQNLLDTDDWKPAQAAEISVQPLPHITTEWENCTSIIDPDTRLATALRCHLVPTSSIPLSPDVFRLGCSRPRCRIFFLPDQPYDNQNRFVFQYEPRYPAQFTSEDVGNPDLFPDQAWITDGFSAGRVAFDIQYTPESQSAMSTNMLEIGDVLQYAMVQSCCSRVLQRFDSSVPDELVF